MDRMCVRIVVMRDGMIEQVGTPLEVYNQPANQFVAGFMGSPPMNFLAGVVVKTSQNEVGLQLPSGLCIPLPALNIAIGEIVTLGIRPEALSVSNDAPTLHPAAISFTGNIIHIEHLGAESYVHLRINEQTLIVRTSLHPHVGETLTVTSSLAKCHFFNYEGNACCGF